MRLTTLFSFYLFVVCFSLHHHLTEHINAEIVLGTITDTNIAQEWLKSTFLYVRMCSNPKFYGKINKTVI